MYAGESKQERALPVLPRVFIVTALVCWCASLFGPFAWKVYSWDGIIYFIMIEVVFLVGLVLGALLPRREPPQHMRRRHAITMGQRQRTILTVFSAVSVISCAYLLIRFFMYYGDSYSFGAAFHEFGEEGRNTFEKILTVVLQLGMASYLVSAAAGCRFSGLRRVIEIIGFWTTAVYYLFAGSRFSVVVGLIIFFVVEHKAMAGAIRSADGAVKRKARIALAMVSVLIVAVGVVTFSRMSVQRRIPENHYEFVEGDSSLKEAYEPMAESGSPLVNSVFSIADYLGEAPFVFSKFFMSYFPTRIYWGANTLRSFGQFFRMVGLQLIPSQRDIYHEIGGGTGKYSGIAYVLIVDFGVYLAPIAAFLFGFVFSQIEYRRTRSLLCSALYPCAFASTAFAPVYYFYVGRLDYVVLWILFVIISLHLSQHEKSGNPAVPGA